MARRQVLDEQLLQLAAAARQLDAQLAAAPARVPAEITSMGVRDKTGSIREFLYRSECDAAQRRAYALAQEIDALFVKDYCK
ncbi:unknown [Orgyia pseudotsugata multiple nucleopolyhedrovirus]|uniref:Uncharacterized protein n=1 Tax=Orgyia pseudotsugata multicapsid polyhedrosis virus TaxID=262177 RepID=O10306_NPVOP|nr:hypothetical protein OpmnVgp051 [Orgyia pseudotsugata multiple nucleopolyhedrovirus]AAC59050.1 unknown [Orgyia pseudotsugata multiple nucleopolyhedrovirus]